MSLLAKTAEAEGRPRMTRDRFRLCFLACPRCGLIRDRRTGRYLNREDGDELEWMYHDEVPPVPKGPKDCPWCEEDLR